MQSVKDRIQFVKDTAQSVKDTIMPVLSWKLAAGVFGVAALSGIGINLCFNRKRIAVDAINLSKLGKIQLQPLTFRGHSKINPLGLKTISANSLWDNTNGLCILAIRRPGCSLCREEALELAHLYETQQFDSKSDNLELIGIVKETLGVEEFHEDYFPYPIYLDSNMSFYEQINGKKMGLWGFLLPEVWNKVWRSQKKGFEGNLDGEGTILGGTVCIKNGNEISYVYNEKLWGDHAPIDELQTAWLQLKEQKK